MGNGGQRQAHENQLCEFLSGGNKRKLSTARGLRSPRVLIRDVDILVGNVSFLWLCFFFFRECFCFAFQTYLFCRGWLGFCCPFFRGFHWLGFCCPFFRGFHFLWCFCFFSRASTFFASPASFAEAPSSLRASSSLLAFLACLS